MNSDLKCVIQPQSTRENVVFHIKDLSKVEQYLNYHLIFTFSINDVLGNRFISEDDNLKIVSDYHLLERFSNIQLEMFN